MLLRVSHSATLGWRMAASLRTLFSGSPTSVGRLRHSWARHTRLWRPRCSEGHSQAEGPLEDPRGQQSSHHATSTLSEVLLPGPALPLHTCPWPSKHTDGYSSSDTTLPSRTGSVLCSLDQSCPWRLGRSKRQRHQSKRNAQH